MLITTAASVCQGGATEGTTLLCGGGIGAGGDDDGDRAHVFKTVGTE